MLFSKNFVNASLNSLEEWSLEKMLYADDAGVVFPSKRDLERGAQLLLTVFKEFGLNMSVKKTKFMVVGPRSMVAEADRTPVVVTGGVDGNKIECVEEFCYLGSIIEGGSRCEREVEARISKASKAFGMLNPSIFRNRSLSTKAKFAIYNATVRSVLTYACETWTLTKFWMMKVERFQRECIRRILGMTLQEQRDQEISTVELYDRARAAGGVIIPIDVWISIAQLRWLGCLQRMKRDRIPRSMLYSRLAPTRPRGGLKRRWKDQARNNLGFAGLCTIVGTKGTRETGPAWVKMTPKGSRQRLTWEGMTHNRRIWRELIWERQRSIQRAQAPEVGVVTPTDVVNDADVTPIAALTTGASSLRCVCGKQCKSKGGLTLHKKRCSGVAGSE